jgi:hypothetical protein
MEIQYGYHAAGCDFVTIDLLFDTTLTTQQTRIDTICRSVKNFVHQPVIICPRRRDVHSLGN